MKFFYSDYKKDNIIWLSILESKHCTRVLRKKKHDNIKIIDGKGGEYLCKIVDDSNSKVITEIISKKKHPNFNTAHLVIAPTKSHDKIDLIIEKSIEIGVKKISFIATKRTIRNKINIDRVNKISISAIKQSGQFHIPEINDIGKYENVISNIATDQRYIAHLEKDIKRVHLSSIYNKKSECCILIGPEGDFNIEEIKFAKKNGFKSISLGSSTLRTETAAIFCISIIKALNEQ